MDKIVAKGLCTFCNCQKECSDTPAVPIIFDFTHFTSEHSLASCRGLAFPIPIAFPGVKQPSIWRVKIVENNKSQLRSFMSWFMYYPQLINNIADTRRMGSMVNPLCPPTSEWIIDLCQQLVMDDYGNSLLWYTGDTLFSLPTFD